MKRILSLILCLLFTLSPGALAAGYGSASAFLEALGDGIFTPGPDVPTAEYEPANAFLEALNEDDLYLVDYDYTYSYEGIASNGDELIIFEFSMEGMHDVTAHLFFGDTEETCLMYIWDVIFFDGADRADVLEAINELNQSYPFARWYAMDGNTVNVEADCNFRNGEGNGEALVETLSLLLRVMEEGYPSLMEYEL